MNPRFENMSDSGIRIGWLGGSGEESLLQSLGGLTGRLAGSGEEGRSLKGFIEEAIIRDEVAYALNDGVLCALLVLNEKNAVVCNEATVSFFRFLPADRLDEVVEALMARVLARVRARGLSALSLEVESDVANQALLDLLHRAGFRPGADTPSRWQAVISQPVDPLTLSPTPLESHRGLASALGLEVDLRVKRDDLYPLAGGGIKARKIQFILQEAVANEHDVIVTNGGPQSNHARATAIECARIGIRCHLVVVVDPDREYKNTGNILLMRMSGAVIEFCTKDQLSGRMDRAINVYAQKGHKPLYLWGGGHCVAGTHAFVVAAKEAQAQSGGWIPDYLVIASGTGSTHAGLAIGYGTTSTRVIGISVARSQAAGCAVIDQCVEDYRLREPQSPKPEIEFLDDWTGEGYEAVTPALLQIVEESARRGFFVDTTYSGKGWHGLVELVRNGVIPRGSKVLFWHSGGLMNLQAGPFAGQSIRLN